MARQHSKMTSPEELIHHDKPFVDLLDDSVWCCTQSQEIADQPNPQGYIYIRENISRLARLSVLNAALALEALANILIQRCAMRGQLANDVDKLTVFGKLDVYLLSRNGATFLDRGHQLTQPMAELINWRNACVHPRVAHRRWEKLAEFSYRSEAPTYSFLKIPMNVTDLGWNPGHARTVLESLFAFITHYLLGWCNHQPLEMRQILFDEGHEKNGNVRHYSYQPSKHMDDAIKDWKLDARFLCLWISKTVYRDGYETVYEPGYPQDKIIRRFPKSDS